MIKAKETKMIAEKRSFYRDAKEVKEIEEKIRRAAECGHMNVFLGFPISKDVENILKINGYTVSRGNRGSDSYIYISWDGEVFE